MAGQRSSVSFVRHERSTGERQLPLLAAIRGPWAPPEKPLPCILLLGLELSEFDELDVSADGLNDGARNVQTADAFVAVREAGGIVVGEGADRRVAQVFIRFPLDVTHGAPNLGDLGAAR